MTVNVLNPQHGWRVKFWFLTTTWTSVEYAFVPATDRDMAIAACAVWVSKLGFTVDKYTTVEAVPEKSGALKDVKL